MYDALAHMSKNFTLVYLGRSWLTRSCFSLSERCSLEPAHMIQLFKVPCIYSSRGMQKWKSRQRAFHHLLRKTGAFKPVLCKGEVLCLLLLRLNVSNQS